MDTDLLRTIYEGTLRAAGAAHGFHLAGGEAFLNMPLLIDAVRMANELGIPIDYVETNAAWFTTADSAVEKLTALREAGLAHLLVSASPFHAEHIPVEKTLGVIEASLAIFGRHGTIVWLPTFLHELTSIRSTGKIAFAEYGKAVGTRRTQQAALYDGQLIPGGRSASALSEWLPRISIEECFGGDCRYELLHSGRGHFDPYGNIVPGVCSGISAGNAHDLVTAYSRFDIDAYPIIKILCTDGVRGLYELATRDFSYTGKDAYAGKCDLCVHIRRHLVSSGADYPELRPKQFYEQM
jgi:hypothetical protein